jgi:hypothetical protein
VDKEEWREDERERRGRGRERESLRVNALPGPCTNS